MVEIEAFANSGSMTCEEHVTPLIHAKQTSKQNKRHQVRETYRFQECCFIPVRLSQRNASIYARSPAGAVYQMVWFILSTSRLIKTRRKQATETARGLVAMLFFFFRMEKLANSNRFYAYFYTHIILCPNAQQNKVLPRHSNSAAYEKKIKKIDTNLKRTHRYAECKRRGRNKEQA